MASKLKLFKTEVTDTFSRENFTRIEDYVTSEVFRRGNFKFFEIEVGGTAAFPKTVSIYHNLGFKPKDVIQLAVTPDTATVTWKYDTFTDLVVKLTASAALTVRAFIGRYGEDT